MIIGKCLVCGANMRIGEPTNADRIREMDDEELAEFLRWVALEGMNGAVSSRGVWTKHELAGGVIVPWIDWLKQEAEEC